MTDTHATTYRPGRERRERFTKPARRQFVSGETHTGTIVRYNSARGYGFIRVDDYPDIFFHCSAADGAGFTIEDGRRVMFKVATNPKDANGRLCAIDLVRSRR